MNSEQIDRLNQMLDIYADDFPFYDGEREELKVTEETSGDVLIARLSLLVSKGFNINAIFNPRYDLIMLPNDYEQHYVNDIVELTQINTDYINKGYNVEAIEWQENKIATFHITR